MASVKKAPPYLVITAFAILYVVWGSTYLFIQLAIRDFPPLMMGGVRFVAAGALLMLWCVLRNEKLWDWRQIKVAVITGILLLFIGNGAVVWAEQTLPSSYVAILISSSPLWFVLLDKPKWKENFTSALTVTGILIGLVGVFLLFRTQLVKALDESENSSQLIGLAILLVGSISWAGGSLYSKYRGSGSTTGNSAWQMIAGGMAFLIGSVFNNEWQSFTWSQVSTSSWLSVLYLILMGSLAGYTAYAWLLKVRPVTQVSTYAYVNPVVAVLLGVLFAGESLSWIQILGLAIILLSVLLINLKNYLGEEKTQNKKTSPVRKHRKKPIKAEA